MTLGVITQLYQQLSNYLELIVSKVSEAKQSLLTGLEEFFNVAADRQLPLLHRAGNGVNVSQMTSVGQLSQKEGVKNLRNVVFEMNGNTWGMKHYQTR